MLPRALKAKYSLTYAQLAVLLAKDVRTIERYCASDRVPAAVLNYCYLLDFYLASTKQLPPFMLLPLEV
jgi:hypothetical protein